MTFKKSRYGRCESCPLCDQKLVLGETNCDKLSEVEVLILAEAPANEEIKEGRPLVGKAGKIFREPFERLNLSNFKYYISNVVLCANINDGKTDNPPQEAVDCCSENVDKLIELCNPKIIFIMGSIPMKRFNIADMGITKQVGLHKNAYKDHDIYLTVHPSYVARNGGLESEVGKQFVSDFQKVYEILSKDDDNKNVLKLDVKEEVFENTNEVKVGSCYSYSFPEWMMKDDVVLIDIQYLKKQNKILFINKNLDTNEKIFTAIDDNKYYYYSQDEIKKFDSRMIEKVQNCIINFSKPPSNYSNSIFEGDVRSHIKYSIDYYYKRNKTVEERDYKVKRLFFDQEVYNEGSKAFPDPKKAEKPINAISFKLEDGPVHVYVLNSKHMEQNKNMIKSPPNKIEIKDNKDVGYSVEIVSKFFDDEKSMIEAFCEFVRSEKIDCLCGWNVWSFDIPTLFGRMTHLKIPLELISPVNYVDFNPNKYGDFCIGGFYVVDQLELYKELTYSVEASYKLSAISKKVLSKTKVSYEGSLDEVYETDIEKFIQYSVVDTNLLWELDETLGHIDQKKELIKTCSSTWDNSESTMGLVDPLLISFAKNNGMVLRNAIIEKQTDSIEGAYVRKPKDGLHTWLIDFDFTSLYPSVGCTFNIGPNTFVGKVDDEIARTYIYDKDLLRGTTIKLLKDPLIKSAKKVEMSFEKFDSIVQQNKFIVTVSGCIYKSHETELSFFYMVWKYLLDSRTVYKNKMKQSKKDKDDMMFKINKNRQLAYKVLANSLYGVLANNAFRMFNRDLARSITLTGQESIKFLGFHLGQYLTNKDLNVDKTFMKDYDEKDIPYLSYTDTDSVFVQMGSWLRDSGIEI